MRARRGKRKTSALINSQKSKTMITLWILIVFEVSGSVYCYALFVFRQTRHSENVCRGVRLHVRTLKYLLFLYRSTFTRLINAGNVSRVRIPTTLVAHSPSSKIVLLLNYFSFEAGGEPKATERPRVRPQSRRDAVNSNSPKASPLTCVESNWAQELLSVSNLSFYRSATIPINLFIMGLTTLAPDPKPNQRLPKTNKKRP